MKKIIIFLCVVTCNLLFVAQVFAATEVGGVLNSNTTWTKSNSPYIITSTVQIPENIVLTIDPGVEVKKTNDEEMFKLKGKLYAHGTIDNKITFSGNNDSDFFKVVGEGNAFLDLKYTVIKNGRMFWPGGNRSGYFSLQNSVLIDLDGQSVLWYPTGDVSIVQNMFINTYGFRVNVDDTNVYIKNNLFYKGKNLNDSGYWNFFIEVSSLDNSKVVVENNSFVEMSENALKLSDNSDNTFSAIKNYWDTQSIDEINDMVYDKNDDISIKHNIVFQPFLSSPDKETPTQETCSSYKYSEWETIGGQEKRTVVDYYPSGCVGGDPILSRSYQGESIEFNFSTEENRHTIDEVFSINAMIDIKNNSYSNALLAVIKFDNTKLSVISLDETDSVCQMFSDGPSYSNETGQIRVACGGINYFKSGEILTINLKAIGAGSSKLEYEKNSFVLRGGTGENMPLDLASTEIELTVKDTVQDNQVDTIDFIESEKSKANKIDYSLSKKLSGKILLQVESNGEGWYVNPGNEKKYYLGRPADAFNIMRKLGLGVSEDTYNSFTGYAPANLSGKILLRVEAKGEAYYVNPVDLKLYYLGRPADAFKVMRELGLGITNNDIRKIDVGDI